MYVSMKVYYTCIAVLFAFCSLLAQTPYQTRIYQPKHIKSLQIRQPEQLFSNPILTLGSGEQLVFTFDDLLSNHGRYAYSIIHCDMDWNPSSLTPIEYLDGFQGLTIDDFANSMATTTSYTNYRLYLPNEDVQFKVSGNYVLLVYLEDNPDVTVFTARFYVVEPLLQIAANVSGNTNIDTYQQHQQLSFALQTKQFRITYPQSDLKVRVTQNNREDNAVTDIQPSTILGDKIIYENIRSLIFPAGNEYRRMEFLSNKYNGMRVENISFHRPFYHVTLLKDYSSALGTYEYDEDQDGRYFINCSGCSDPDTEADYYFVHFTLAMPLAKDGKIYLQGEAFDDLPLEDREMIYNPDTREYEASVLLKQGNYNYQYIYVKDGETRGITAPVEGDYHQTENEYSIYVYYRPIGARYDRLVGISTLISKQQ